MIASKDLTSLMLRDEWGTWRGPKGTTRPDTNLQGFSVVHKHIIVKVSMKVDD